MNGILCAYARDAPEHAERRRHRVAAALDRELHDVLGIEVHRIGCERRPGRVLDALIDREPIVVLRIFCFGPSYFKGSVRTRTFADTLGMSALPITDLGGERHATFFATGGAMR